MRILILDTCYPAFLTSHYDRHPGLEQRPYDEQWRALMGTYFGTSDAYSHNLGRLGHEAHEVVVDCGPLQSAWAREHAQSLVGGPTDSILLAQVEWFAPEVIYIQNLHVLSDQTLATLRRSGAMIAGQIASEAPPVDRLRMYDLILTSFPHFVEEFRALGVASEYFRIGFDERVLDQLDGVEQRYDVVFVGALNAAKHRAGNRVLAHAARGIPIDFWGYDLHGWPPWSTIRRRYHGEAWGLDMYRLLASGRAVLNRHIADARQYANNMRLYEATGVGSLLVTDDKANLRTLFEPGTEVVAYSDADDLVDKVRHYLAHDGEREVIAAAGQARTLRDHTYAIRMQELVPLLEAYLP